MASPEINIKDKDKVIVEFNVGLKEDQKKSAEFSKSDLYPDESSGDFKQNSNNMLGSEKTDTEKEKANESNNTSGPPSRHQI